MTPTHHPSDMLLLDYATGSMKFGPRLVVTCHLDVCALCRETVLDAELVGGALLSSLPETDLSPDALELALARIERPFAPPIALNVIPHDWILVPGEVGQALNKRRRWAAPGVWVAPVATGPGQARSYLLGIAAGMSVPRHTHRGNEFVCVLKGAYRDGQAIFYPGDFAFSDNSVEHRPRITDDGDCVCLIAADSALVPRDWVGRLFQPIVGI